MRTIYALYSEFAVKDYDNYLREEEIRRNEELKNLAKEQVISEGLTQVVKVNRQCINDISLQATGTKSFDLGTFKTPFQEDIAYLIRFYKLLGTNIDAQTELDALYYKSQSLWKYQVYPNIDFTKEFEITFFNIVDCNNFEPSR